MDLDKDFFASQTSVRGEPSTSDTTERDKKVKATHVHYAFLVVDAWCAYGVPLGAVQQLRDRLNGGGSTTFLDSVLAKQRQSQPELTGDVHPKVKVVVWPAAAARVLEKWPVNSLWSEFLIDLKVDDSEARNAQQQVDAFVRFLKWPQRQDLLKGFMSCVQLWYYGMPVEKVWADCFICDLQRQLCLLLT
jgi:hypothetical protein